METKEPSIAIENDKTKICTHILTKVNDIITKIYNKHVFGSNDLAAEEIDAIINFSDDITYELDNLLREIESDESADVIERLTANADNDREKLIELICETINSDCVWHCDISSQDYCYECMTIADHLIANGVTFTAYTEEDVRNAYNDGYSTGMEQGMSKRKRGEWKNTNLTKEKREERL